MSSAESTIEATESEEATEHHRIVIVGAGFAGLGMAISLRRRGIEDFLVLERGSSVGGTWRDNTYPGCACDVPSHLYSLSFAPNPDWTRSFSAQPEIHGYMKDTAARSGVDAQIRFDTEMTDASWDEDAGLWRIETSGGLDDRTGPDLGDRRPDRAAAPRRARDRGLRGRGLPLGPLEPRLRPRRQAGRRDRHRRLGDPVRPPDPARGRRAPPLPAHAGLDRAAQRPPDQLDRARGSRAASRRSSASPAASISGAARRSCSASSSTRG